MKLKYIILSAFLIILTLPVIAQISQHFQKRLAIKVTHESFWWDGVVNQGSLMPLKANYHANIIGNNYNNQIQPLLLSSKGEVIWSNDPFEIEYTADSLIIKNDTKIDYIKAGENLKQAYLYACRSYFPFTGKTPYKLLFSNPQYNTWIELVYNQNQDDVLKYAQSIINNGLTPGVLMIDDNWQEDYGNWCFHPGRFKSPKEMISKLHTMGFKIMVWVCPFVSADSENGREVVRKKLVLQDKNNQPAIINWWNGYSLLLDFSNPKAVEWFKNSLNVLVNEYGVDGFKFDAGDAVFYKGNIISFVKNTSANDHSTLYGKIGLDYPLNEYRAMWKMGGQPIANRLADKRHNWLDLQELIPNMITEGLMGYAFSCPDMIGGGEFGSFQNLTNIDQDLIVRSAQCHALMPMMQFSVAPWRILDKPHFDAVLKAIKLREHFKDYILETVEASAKSGEPVLRSMEYVYPQNSYEMIKDQFLLGDSLLVAPILTKNTTKRTIVVPNGLWKTASDQLIKGPKRIEVSVQLDELPYLQKVK
ncbi:MAG: alpha-galactosidase [Bacteroidetes bacterium]|nr:alpha-galactosidase [Bacteroidota bacterium]